MSLISLISTQRCCFCSWRCAGPCRLGKDYIVCFRILLLFFFVSSSTALIAQFPHGGAITTTNGTGMNIASKYLTNMASRDQTKYVKIKSNIPFQNFKGMTSIQLNYWGYGRAWETTVGWYVYNGKFYSPNVTISGVFSHKEVIMANDGGKVVIYIPNSGFSHYGNLSVHSMTSGLLTSDWADNWEITLDQIPVALNKVVLMQGNSLPTKGRIGINTVTPKQALEVKGGNILLSGHANDAGDLIFQNHDGDQLGRIWTTTSGDSGLALSSGNNSPDIYINDVGNVGIGYGVTAPSEALVVRGSIGLYYNGSGIAHNGIRRNGVASEYYNNITGTAANVIHEFKGSGNLSLMSLTQGGNVGIGTRSPLAKLHVFNGNHSYGAILANSSETAFSLYTKSLDRVPYTETFRIGLKHNSNENNGFISFYRGGSTSGGFLGLSTNGSERIRIAANGKVGIGTNNPDEALTVKGTIHTHEVRVDMDSRVVPDYVFEPDYQLMPLYQVEAFINTENHLPEVPSASEMEANGVNLKEMNMLLLKKIEELTLHIIEMKKDHEELKKYIQSLEAKIK